MKKLIVLVLLFASSTFAQNWDSAAWIQQRDSATQYYNQFEWLCYKSLDQIRVEDSIFRVRWSTKQSCEQISKYIQSYDSSNIEITLNQKMQKYMLKNDGREQFIYETLRLDDEKSYHTWYWCMNNYLAQLEARFPTH